MPKRVENKMLVERRATLSSLARRTGACRSRHTRERVRPTTTTARTARWFACPTSSTATTASGSTAASAPHPASRTRLTRIETRLDSKHCGAQRQLVARLDRLF